MKIGNKTHKWFLILKAAYTKQTTTLQNSSLERPKAINYLIFYYSTIIFLNIKPVVTDYNFNSFKHLEQNSEQTRIDKSRNLGMITWLNKKVTFLSLECITYALCL